MLDTSKKLDKYYTKSNIASLCCDALLNVVNEFETKIFIEPSAGSGSFVKELESRNFKVFAYDILPEGDHIEKLNFLVQDIKNISDNHSRDNLFVIGNPPFGYKGGLAIDFIHKSFNYSDTVGFILPNQFKKWSAQSKIRRDARLILDLDLPDNSFTLSGKDYDFRCSFQVWTIDPLLGNNIRLLIKPTVDHEDFSAYQYNCTEDSKKFIDQDWDFAVPRQGYQDYSLRITDKDNLDLKKQWMFIKAHNETALNILINIDYDKLSKLNLTIPGFGKADLVKEYNLWKK